MTVHKKAEHGYVNYSWDKCDYKSIHIHITGLYRHKNINDCVTIDNGIIVERIDIGGTQESVSYSLDHLYFYFGRVK